MNLDFAKNRMIIGILSGWGVQVISICMGLITFPLFFRYLPKEELGIWLLFLGTGVFVNLSDLGFSQVFSRHIAFELGKGDSKTVDTNSGVSYYYSIARYVSIMSALPLLFGMLVLGFLFIWSMELSESIRGNSYLAWTIFSFSQAILCRGKYLETTLIGHGEIFWQNFVNVSSQAITLLAYFIVLKYKMGGIVGLSVVILGRSLFVQGNYWFINHFRISKNHRRRQKVTWNDLRKHIRSAMDMFLISLGAFLILNTDQYFIVKFLGAAHLPDYAAAYRMVEVAFVFASNASAMCSPFVARMSAAGSRTAVNNLLMVNTTVGMMIQIGAVCIIGVFGDYLIQFWLGTGHFVGWEILWIFCAMLTLQNHHVIFAWFGISAKADPSWGKISIIAGILNIILTFFGVQIMGLLGVALSTMVAQLLTNNWYAVWKTLRILKIEFKDYVQTSGLVWFTAGLILMSAMVCIRNIVFTPIMSLVAAGVLIFFAYSLIYYKFLRKRITYN